MRESGRLDEINKNKQDMQSIAGIGSSVNDSQDEDNQEHPLNEWEKLQNLPHDQYLVQTIMPVLYQGLKVISIERPKCPIKALAVYMLKNQDKVKLPERK